MADRHPVVLTALGVAIGTTLSAFFTNLGFRHEAIGWAEMVGQWAEGILTAVVVLFALLGGVLGYLASRYLAERVRLRSERAAAREITVREECIAREDAEFTSETKGVDLPFSVRVEGEKVRSAVSDRTLAGVLRVISNRPYEIRVDPILVRFVDERGTNITSPVIVDGGVVAGVESEFKRLFECSRVGDHGVVDFATAKFKSLARRHRSDSWVFHDHASVRIVARDIFDG